MDISLHEMGKMEIFGIVAIDTQIKSKGKIHFGEITFYEIEL